MKQKTRTCRLPAAILILFILFNITGCSKVETKRISIVKEIPFETIRETDDTLGPGQTVIKAAGEKGFKRVTYEVTLEDGEEKSRTVVKEKIIKKPVDQVVSIGPAGPSPGSKGDD